MIIKIQQENMGKGSRYFEIVYANNLPNEWLSEAKKMGSNVTAVLGLEKGQSGGSEFG